MLGLAAVLIGGTIVRWYLGVVGVILVVVSGGAWQAVLSKNLTTYLRFVANSLAQREADYRKNGDEDRAGAAHDFFIGVAGMLEKSAAESLQVPSVREASNAPFGQVGL